MSACLTESYEERCGNRCARLDDGWFVHYNIRLLGRTLITGFTSRFEFSHDNLVVFHVTRFRGFSFARAFANHFTGDFVPDFASDYAPDFGSGFVPEFVPPFVSQVNPEFVTGFVSGLGTGLGSGLHSDFGSGFATGFSSGYGMGFGMRVGSGLGLPLAPGEYPPYGSQRVGITEFAGWRCGDGSR